MIATRITAFFRIWPGTPSGIIMILEYEILKYDGDLGQPNVFVPSREQHRPLERSSCS